MSFARPLNKCYVFDKEYVKFVFPLINIYRDHVGQIVVKVAVKHLHLYMKEFHELWLILNEKEMHYSYLL